MKNISPQIQRWIYSPLQSAVEFFYVGFLFNYMIMCIADAYVNGEKMVPFHSSRTYNITLTLIITFINIIIIPFKSWELFLIGLVNCAMIFPLPGIAYGLIVAPKFKESDKFNSPVNLFLGSSVVFFIYWFSMYSNKTTMLLTTYISQSRLLLILCVIGIVIWLLFTYIKNSKPPKEKPLS
jgi:hypothetical protein